MIRRLFFILMTILLVNPVFSQIDKNKLTSSSRSAKKSLIKSLDYFSMRELNMALSHAKKAVDTDTEFVEAYMLLADIYQGLNKKELAFASIQKAIEVNPDFYAFNYFRAGRMAINIGDYKSSKKHFENYLKTNKGGESTKVKAEELLDQATFAAKLVENPVKFDPINLGPNVNSEYDDYVNAITIDDSLLIYTIKEASSSETNTGKRFEENFYISEASENGWAVRNKLPPPLNTNGDEGAICVTPDGLTAYYAAKRGQLHNSSFDLFVSYREGDQWTRPMNLGTAVNDPRWWDSQPSISADGRTLYFVSNRKGGFGSSDIYMTYLTDDSGFSVPKNLGSMINTKAEEFSPRIHHDGKTLYFASKGHRGLGGYDIFMSQKDEEGNWSEPKNLGYPLNTHNDEFCPVLNGDGTVAYFSSDQLGGEGGMDIFQFELDPSLRPEPVTFLKGRVFDKETNDPLFALFRIIDLETEKVITSSFSDPVSGDFMIAIPLDRNYAFNAEANKYLFYSDHFSLKGVEDARTPYYKDVPMSPIKSNTAVVLRNIFFDTDKSELLDDSKVELEKLLLFLKQNYQLKVEIGGHTDDVADATYNQKLSERRAKAVYDYLLDQGVDVNRLSYKGYGELSPIGDNQTKEGRASNRRTEFKIIDE